MPSPEGGIWDYGPVRGIPGPSDEGRMGDITALFA